MGDVDNLDDDLAKLDLAPRVTSAKVNKNQYNSKPIDVKTAVVSYHLVAGLRLALKLMLPKLPHFCKVLLYLAIVWVFMNNTCSKIGFSLAKFVNL